MPQETPQWRAMREASGLSLREVSRRTGISPGRLSQIERPPTKAESDKLRAVLGLEILAQSKVASVEDGSVPA
jgi:transcriptional regulator with XRE-family HTH domain